MAWEKWEQLKADAAEGQAERMRLNQLPDGPGGGVGQDLVVHDNVLGAEYLGHPPHSSTT